MPGYLKIYCNSFDFGRASALSFRYGEPGFHSVDILLSVEDTKEEIAEVLILAAAKLKTGENGLITSEKAKRFRDYLRKEVGEIKKGGQG